MSRPRPDEDELAELLGDVTIASNLSVRASLFRARTRRLMEQLMTTDNVANWKTIARALSRAVLGQGVGACHDVGYTREQVHTLVDKILDGVVMTKQRLDQGDSPGEVVDDLVDNALKATEPEVASIEWIPAEDFMPRRS